MSALDFGFFLALPLLPLFIIGIVGLVVSVRFMRPLVAKLGFSNLDRGARRRLLFAGCVNAPEEIAAEVSRCRRAFASVCLLILGYCFFFLGIGAGLFFVALFLLNFLTARPFEIPEEVK